jgi:ketosteroid isomerase-like protein
MRIHLFNWLALAVIFATLAVATAAQTKPAKPRQNKARDEAQIRAVMDAQAAAWNRGDVTAYMDGYWRSPKTEFVSGDRVTRGWQTVLEHYQKSYDSREKMGALTFSELEITVLSPDAAVALGKWELERAKDHPHGYFTLLFRRVKAGWRIVQDHTSSAN